MTLALEWTKGCRNEKEKQVREELVQNSVRVLEVIRGILGQKLLEVRKNNLKASNYNNPSWAYKQADNIGYSRALTEVLQLMEINKDNE